MKLKDRAMIDSFTKLISISDFSKGKTSGIFEDVKNNDAEYVVLKNNQPTGVVVPYDMYQETKKIISKIQKVLIERTPKRLGIAKGKFEYSENFMELDKEIEKLFFGDNDAIIT